MTRDRQISSTAARKRRKLRVLAFLKAVGAFALSRALTRRRIRILCYHGIWRGGGPFAGYSMFMGRETFHARMAWLRSSGYHVVSLQSATDRATPSGAKVVITIDDGWYSTFEDMLPALMSLRLPATLYCDTRNLMSEGPVAHVMARYLKKFRDLQTPEAQDAFDRATNMAAADGERQAALAQLARIVDFDLKPWLSRRAFDYMTAAELRELARAGVAVELHTHRHTLHDFSQNSIADEISANRACLAELLDRPSESFTHFCYPSGQTEPGADRVLASLDVATATTLTPGLADPDKNRLLWPRILDGEHLSLLEFEAELAGVGDVLRSVAARLKPLLRSPAPPRFECGTRQ